MSKSFLSINLFCLAMCAASVQMTGCATENSPSNKPVEMEAAGYDCTVQDGLIRADAFLDLTGNASGFGFLIKNHNFDGFSIDGRLHMEFLSDEVSGTGSISLRPPIDEWTAWESRTVITEVLRSSGGQLDLVETLPPYNIAGYVFISKPWSDLREMTSSVDFLTFRIKSVEGEVLYERDFDTQKFWKLNRTMKRAAVQIREKINSYKTQCEYRASRPKTFVVVTQN